jgi:DNA-binding HxlR family transcriptional regulator
MSKKKRLHRISRRVNQVAHGVEMLTHQLRQLNQNSWVRQLNLKPEEFPYVQELITDTHGQVSKVVLHFEDYQRLLAGLKPETTNNSGTPRLTAPD